MLHGHAGKAVHATEVVHQAFEQLGRVGDVGPTGENLANKGVNRPALDLIQLLLPNKLLLALLAGGLEDRRASHCSGESLGIQRQKHVAGVALPH